MADSKSRLIPLDEYKRTMPRPLSADQIAEYVRKLDEDEGGHETIICGSDNACLDRLSPKGIETVAVRCASQVHQYINMKKLPREAFRQLQEAQGIWARERVAAQKSSETVDDK